MIYPMCEAVKIRTPVVASDVHPHAVVRTRECPECGHQWSTIEICMDPATMDQVHAILELAAKLDPRWSPAKRPWMKRKPRKKAAGG